ncbi:hypothetical protein Q3G72_003622 [Acer saccharum]|nr:hypothetical protein Q3G72_003622 [Acer saccharum]
MSAVEILTDDIYLGVEQKCKIFTVRKRSDSLAVVNEYHIGDFINMLYYRSSDVIPRVLFGTDNGAIVKFQANGSASAKARKSVTLFFTANPRFASTTNHGRPKQRFLLLLLRQIRQDLRRRPPRTRRIGHSPQAHLVLRTHSELDLTRQSDVEYFFSAERPVYVILAAAKVGGIHANNTYPAEFISVNLQIQTNVIDSSFRFGVKKLLFLGSSCIYPKFAPQPIPESALLTAPLEPTNEWYAIAKIAGIKMCQAYRIQHNFNAISGMPTNLYGPHDNFHPENSHVLPALMRRFHEAKTNKAKEVVVWGTGSPLREFLHVDDLADAVVFMIENYSGLEHLNVGSGKEVTIKELAELVKEVVGFEGDLVWDSSKPDGTPRKLMDSSKLAALGWQPKVELKDGLVDTYKWYLENVTQ